MGSVTDLKENKTLFMPCDSKSEILVIEYDHKTLIANLAIYENRINYCHKLSLWQRIKYCYEVLIHKKPHADQINLDSRQLKDLRKFLSELNLT